MSVEYYSPDQLLEVSDLIGPEIETFLLAGPADGNEAHTLYRLRPDIRIMGFEPNPTFCRFQIDNGFPGRLFSTALWSEPCYLPLDIPGSTTQANRMSSLIRQGGSKFMVSADTLDRLSAGFGPFHNSFLWADVEEAELMVLKGATDLLAPKHIRGMCLEVLSYAENAITPILSRIWLQRSEKMGSPERSTGVVERCIHAVRVIHNATIRTIRART